MKAQKFGCFSILILSYILILSLNNLVAQIASLRPGDLVKLTLLNQKSIIGTFTKIQNDTLALYNTTMAMAVPLWNVKRLEVARGEKTNMLKGAIAGGFTGFLIAAAYSQEKYVKDKKENDLDFGLEGFAAMVASAMGFGIGSFAGAFIGSWSKSSDWVNVTLLNFNPKEKAIFFDSSRAEQKRMQMPPQNTMAVKYRWSCSVSSGVVLSPVGNDLENAMAQNGFDAPVIFREVGYGYYYEKSYYPISNTDPLKIGMPLSLQLNCALTAHLNSAFLVLHSTFVKTNGHHINPEVFLTLKARAIALCPMVILNPPNRASELGIGPGIFFNQIDLQNWSSDKISRQQKIKLGLVFHSALRFPQKTRWFASIGLQCRWIPKVSFGPFKVGSGETSSTFHRFTSDLSHVYLSAGLGYYL